MTIKRQAIKAGLLVSILLLVGCAAPLSKESRSRVDKKVTFEALVKDPGAYKGTTVMFGGEIINCANLANATELEILQKPLGARSAPIDTDTSGGRLFLISKSFLDPVVYKPGRLITFVGVVSGSGERAVGAVNYRYPIIDEVEHHLWSPDELSPRVHVGVGVGVGIP